MTRSRLSGSKRTAALWLGFAMLCSFAAADMTAFIGVQINHPEAIAAFEREIGPVDDVLDCHHVTGSHTLMLKVKTATTESLERLIDRMRCIEGVMRTETMIVLSSHTERTRIGVPAADDENVRQPRRSPGSRLRRAEGV